MAYSIQLPDGTLVQNIPDEVDPSVAKQRILAQHPELAPKSGMLESLGAGIGGGLAKMGLGAAAAAADYTGNKDTAAALDAKRQAITDWQKQHGGESLSGMVGEIGGASVPALAIGAAGSAFGPVGTVAAEAVNAGLFGIPAFRDEYNSQKANGASEAAAISHAAWQAGLATVGARVVSSGGKLLPGVAKAGEGLLAKAGIAGAEGAALPVVGQVGTKAIDTATGQQNDAGWLPSGKDVAASALGFGALGGAHHLMEAPARARAQADADQAKTDADAVKAQQQADFEAQQTTAKQTPEYLQALDTKYRTLLQQEQAAKAAIGPKPDKATDPSAFMAWQAKQAEVGKMRQDPEAAATITEHAERRGDIDAMKAQEANAAQQAAQASQTAMEATADQTDTRSPVDTRVTPLDQHAQPDLFAEGQTAPSGTPEKAPAELVPIEQQLQAASQALVDHENSMNALRDQAKAAVASGDMDAVVRASTQANELAKQLKPLQDAVEQLRGQHKPSVDADVAKLKQKLQDAADLGDTAKLAKIAAEIKEKQASFTPSLTSKENLTRTDTNSNALVNDMADGRENAAATTAEVEGIKGLAVKNRDYHAQQHAYSEYALAARNADARDAQAAGKPEPTYAQEALPEAGQPGVATGRADISDNVLQGRVDKLGETLVNPEAAAMEQQIRELKREQAQHIATLNGIGEIKTAEQAETQRAATAGMRDAQTRINEIEQRLRINPHNADTVSKVDDLHRQLEQANNARESARASNNAPAVESAALRAKQIADQLAQVQKEPGSFAGRLVKAKNDVSSFLNAFFDAAHELHTSNMVPRLREKQQAAQRLLHRLNITPAHTPDAVHRQRAERDEITRQMHALDRQLGAMNTETNPKKLAIMARQAINKYVRASFREENIRREARQQKPLTGAERAAFAKQATKHAEDLLTRVMADRGGDYMEEHVVHPAQTRGSKIVKNAVTEWRDTRPLSERPLAKFGAARAVEEEAFQQERQSIQAPVATGKRVAGTGVSRQWDGVQRPENAQGAIPVTSAADQRANNERLLQGTSGRAGAKAREGLEAADVNGPQARRARYLTNMLNALERDNPRSAGERFALQPLRDALEESPTTGVMDIIEPMLHEARTGRLPLGGERLQGSELQKFLGGGKRVELPSADMARLKEALALARDARTGDETAVKQRDLFDPQVAQQEQGRIEDKQAANEVRADEIDNTTYKSPEEAAQALKEKGKLSDANDTLDKEKSASKDDEQALKGESARMATSFERTTPARFANAPEVKAGRAAADEQAKLVSDIHDQLQELAKSDAAPSDLSKLSKMVAALREHIASFKAARPFAGLKGLMEGLSRRYAYMEPETLLVDGKEVPNPKYNAEQQAKIQAELDRYNKFVDDTSKFIADRAGTDTPEYQSLTQQLKEATDAIRAIPTDPELAEARKLVALHTKALRKLLDMPEPTKPAGRAIRQKNIENTQDTLRMAQGILKLKETTSTDISAPARKAALEETAQQATARRQTEAVAQKQRNDKLDAAVEERMKMDEMQQRLAKLPTTRRVTESESVAARLMSTGLRREAAGLERMLEIARKDGAPEAYVTKLEGLLAKSNLAYEQMEARLPKMRERSNESAREADLRVELDEARRQPKPDKERIESLTQQIKDAGKARESEDLLQPVETPQFTGKQRAKKIDAAIAAAEALNEKQQASGRPVVTRKIGPGQGKTSATRGRRKENPDQAARLDAVGAEVEQTKSVREAQAAVDKIEDLQERLAARRISDPSRANKKKYDAYEAKMEEEHAKATTALEAARGESTPTDVTDADAAANKPTAERASTPLSDEAVAAVKENRLPDALHDVARTSADPEAREAAAKLAPFVDKTAVGVERFTVRGEEVPAAYIPAENRVAMHPDGLTEQELLHEAAHAATDGVMLADPAKLNPEQRKARAGLEGMWNSIKGNESLAGEHAITSPREFVAEVYTNPEFRAKLDAIGKPLSLLERFKNFVRQMFGYPTSPSGKARDMVDKILTRADKIKGDAAPSTFRKAPEYTTEAAKFGRDLSQNRSVVQDVKAAGWKKLMLAAEQKIVDSRAALRYTAKIGDKHTGTQVMGDVLTADKALQNAMAVFTHGAMKLVKDAKGYVVMKAGGKVNAKDVVERVGELPGAGSVAEKMDLFQGYMTALRARDVGWHTLDYDNPAEMQRRGEAAIKEVQSDPALLAAMNKAQDTYHEYNKGLVQFLKDTNAVPDTVADKMMQDRNYIPMFRNKGDTLEMVMQNGKPMSVGDVRTLPFLHALNGGNAKLMPFEESMFRNTTMLTNLGVQNMTARHIAYHLQGLGKTAQTMQITRGDGGASRGGTTLRFRDKPQGPGDDGERHVVIDTKGTAAEHIPNDLLAQAVAGSYSSTPALLNVGKFASDILRSGVTRMPTYLVSQMWKDPVNAAIMGNLKADPFSATVKSMNNMREHFTGKSAEAHDMEAMGILHSNVFNGTPDDVKKMLMHLGGSNQGWYRNAMSKLDNIAMGADAATRIQGYRDVIKAGGSELEAAIHAQEMQNFSKHGSSQSMQIISRLVPFFNAQVQGLNVLLKSATGKMPADQILDTKNQFFKRAVGMTAISLAYAAYLDDDPEWRKLTLRSQMSNIKVGDFHVPAPFETGMLFYSLPVAFIHALKQNFNENDWTDVKEIIKNQLPGNGSIVPQAAKGYLDVSRNYNSSFGTPIETKSMDRKDTTEKFAANTPEMMKEFSRHLVDMGVNLSPVQLDYLANAYLGQLPHMVGMLTNHLFETKSAAHDSGEAATGTAHDNPLLSRFVSNPKESRNVNDAYTRANQAALTDATVKSMVKDGRGAEAKAYQQEQFAKYGHPAPAQKFTAQMGFLKRQEEAINSNKSLSGAEKEAKLVDLYARRDKVAKDYLKIVDAKQAQ